ncbi:MAG: hypothetical protein EXS37_16485 [Opitutus sp.]|nr:hypothetical protein [Opitutus sp.]
MGWGMAEKGRDTFDLRDATVVPEGCHRQIDLQAPAASGLLTANDTFTVNRETQPRFHAPAVPKTIPARVVHDAAAVVAGVEKSDDVLKPIVEETALEIGVEVSIQEIGVKVCIRGVVGERFFPRGKRDIVNALVLFQARLSV